MKNMKIIYAGIIIPLMLASVFIGFVANDVIFNENKDLGSVIDRLTGNSSNSSLPEQPPEPLTGQLASKDSTPETPIDTWKEGESVKVDYEFASFTLDYSQSDWVDAPTNDPPSPKRLLDKLGNALVDDGNDANLQFISDQESTTHRDIFRWVIPISENVPRTGTIYLESGVSFTAYIDSITHVSYYFLRNDGLGHTVHSLDVTSPYDTKDITLDIADYIQEDGKIYGKISIEYDTDANNNDHKLFVSIDHFCYSPDSVTEHVRSEYLYSSGGVISQQLDFWNPSSSDIEIFLPLNWDSIEISPIIDYSLDSDNTMEILGVPGNTFFTLRASQNSSKQYLAISTEKSYDMEGELPDHQIITSSTGYDGDYGISDGWSSINYKGDNTLNSTIVSNGAFSLRMDGNFDSPNYRAYLGFYVPYGEYYFSFDYYVESSDGTLAFFDFFIAGSGTVVSALTLDQTANRWHKGFAFGNCKYTYYSQAVICVRDTSDFVVFFDNIQFLKVNHEQETIDYSQTLFSGQLNSWTSYGLIPIPFEEINLELRDRTEDSSIKAIETMTDSQGFFYWNFQGKLLEKEYELRSYSPESWFGCQEFSTDPTERQDENDWYAGGFTSVSESFSTDSKWGDYSYQIDALEDDGTNNYLWYDMDNSHFDIAFCDLLIIYVKSNTTLNNPDWYIMAPDDANRWEKGNFGAIAANIWLEHRFFFREDSTIFGNPDSADINYIRFDSDLPSGSVKINLEMKVIQSQKSYFTPQSTGSIDYAISEQENNPLDYSNYWGLDGIDFSEETVDGCSSDGVDGAENGYLYCIPSAGDNYDFIFLDYELKGNTETYFTTISMRIMVNMSNEVIIYPKDESGGFFSPGTQAYTPTSTSWQIYEWDLSGNSDFYLDHTFLFDYRVDNASDVSPSGLGIFIDWIRLTHKDSDLENGNSWEFNDYFPPGDDTIPHDGWVNANGVTAGTMVVNNGYFQFEDSSGGPYCRIKTFDYLNWDDITGLIVRIKINTIVDSPKINVGQEGGSITGFQYIYTDWTTHIFEFSWTGNYQMRIGLDQSGGGGSWTTDVICQIEFIRWIIDSPPNLYETQTDLLLENEGFLDYITFTDSIFSGYYTNMDFIGKNLTIGSHSFVYSAFYDYLRFGVTLPSAFYQYDYDIDEIGIMKVIIHDQSGNVIPFDSMEVYIDSTRLFDNYIYFPDISQTFNLTITDLFENMLYQDTTEDFENFKEIQLTLHSIKVQNLQENPIWLNIIRDSKTFSEWIYPYEIVKYRLEAATYDFKIYYCDSLAADLGAFSTNGSWVNFEYAVSSDSALMVTGETIQDVFDNVLSLTQDLDSVNTSMHIAFEDQSQNFTLQFTATNQNITFMLGNSSLIIGNLNSNFTAILGDLILLDSNINGNFTSTFLSIAGNTTLLVNQLNSNFTNLNGLIISNNTVLYTQLVHTLADLAELKGLYRVHFSVIDGAGIGLPFETVLLNVNDSRQFDQDVYLSNNTYFEAEAFDWFDVSLWSDNFSITKRTEVNISIQLYWVLFENNGSYTSYLEIWRNNKLGVNITVAPDQTVSIRLTEGVYDYRVYYFKNDSQQTKQKDPSIYSYGRRLLSIGKFAVSALMPTKINVSTPKIKLPLLDAIMAELTLVEIIANVILTVLGLAASYFVLNFIVRRAIGRHAQDPSYVPPRKREDWLDKLEKKTGVKTDDEGLW